MAINLPTLHQQVLAHETLWESRDALLNGLLALLDDNSSADVAAALREMTPVEPGDTKRKVTWLVLLGNALTQNTSHVAVDHRHPGFETACRLLTHAPELDKAAAIADLEQRLAAKTVEYVAASADLGTAKDVIDQHKAAHTHAVGIVEERSKQLATAREILDANAQQIAALTAQLAAKDAVISAAKAELTAASVRHASEIGSLKARHPE